MMLVIGDRSEQTLLMDDLMTVPTKKQIFETSINPTQPRLANFEAWPHLLSVGAYAHTPEMSRHI